MDCAVLIIHIEIQKMTGVKSDFVRSQVINIWNFVVRKNVTVLCSLGYKVLLCCLTCLTSIEQWLLRKCSLDREIICQISRLDFTEA